MNTDRENQRISLALLLMYCLNFTIVVYYTGVIGFTLSEIIDANLARDFLASLSIMPLTPPFRSFQYALITYVLLVVVHMISVRKDLSKLFLSLIFLVEMILCIFVMYTMGFSSNAIILLFIANVLYNSRDLELRTIFLLLGSIVFIFSNNDIFSQIEIVSLSDYLSFYTGSIKAILQGIESAINSFNFVVFLIFMFLLIQKEMKDSKQMRTMYQEVKVLNEQLKEYASLQEKMGETKERNRLAREIHDTLGHTLTGLSVGIDAANTLLNVDKEATRKQLNVLSETARKGLEEVRRSVAKLRPDALERYTLEEAIEKMIFDFEKISGVNISFMCHLGEMSFGIDIDEFVYRFVQEGITNAMRYGNPSHIVISIAKDYDNNLILIMEDDGVGCKDIKLGFGLYHMKERVDQLCGNLYINGEHGFTVIAEIPSRQ